MPTDTAGTSTPKTTKPRKTKKASTTSAAATNEAVADTQDAVAKSHFNKAIEEAKAGAAALGKEAKARAQGYRTQAKSQGSERAGEAKVKARGFADEGKKATSQAIAGLGDYVNENASYVDEKLGARYGDYARTASRKLGNTASALDAKEIDELLEDGREFVRRSPGMAVGIAAVVGYMFAGLFRR